MKLPGKTAVVLSVVACGALLMSVRAQERQEPRSGLDLPPDKPSPFDNVPVPPPPATASEVRPSPGFVGPPGLSEEAARSFRELPVSTSRGEDGIPEEPPPDASPPTKPEPRPEYIVEPPDLLLVEVLEAMPGRPISGERLVRPDGRISLGFYGDIPVDGLTLPQIKERIVLHLRRYINDDVLGLVDIETNGPKRDASGKVVVKNPCDTDRVFVDVTSYNSKHCYVLGEVTYPGTLPYTGGDTVLDLLQYAGGPLATAERRSIRLIRSFPRGSAARVLPINYEEITMGTDSSTNYAVLPGDRLVIPKQATPPRRPAVDVGEAETGTPPLRDPSAARTSSPRVNTELQNNPFFDRGGYEAARRSSHADLEWRIGELEKKMDRLIELLEKKPANPDGEAAVGDPAPRRPRARRPGSTEPRPRPRLPEPDPFADVPPRDPVDQ